MMTRPYYPLHCTMVTAALLVLLTAEVSQAITINGGTITVNDTSAPVTAANFTDVEQENTLKFLQGFATSNPALTSNWTGTDFCSWSHINCNIGGGGLSVVQNDLTLLSSAGTVVLPELAGDVNGSAVVISAFSFVGLGTALKGTLPESWAGLPRLWSVDVSGSAVSGTLPGAWSKIGSLTFLTLSDNALTGTLPDVWSTLPSLTFLTLTDNALTGSLPPSWGSMPSLTFPKLVGNQLCGCIPEEWESKRFFLKVDAAVSAADCATANACGAQSPPSGLSSTTTPTATPTTTTPTATPTTATPTPTSGAGCGVEHCVKCQSGSSSECALCAARYVVTPDLQCKPEPNAAGGPVTCGAAVWAAVLAACAVATLPMPV